MKKMIKALLVGGLLMAQSVWAAVNVNTATAEQIADELKGIGLAKAKAIVEHRKTNGPFKTVESLTEVKGIGLKTVEKNRKDIVLK